MSNKTSLNKLSMLMLVLSFLLLIRMFDIQSGILNIQYLVRNIQSYIWNKFHSKSQFNSLVVK